MIINYKLRHDGTFDFWQVYPIVDDLPKLEIEDPRVIKLGITKLIDGKIIQPVEDSSLKLERTKALYKLYRKQALSAFDTWEKNVLMGREDSDEYISNTWYNEMLDFTNKITVNTTREDFPKIPDRIKYYM